MLPAGVDDPARPSGGNVYDRELAGQLVARGHEVREYPVADTRAELAGVLEALPQDALVLVDGLLASHAAHEARVATARVRLLVLVHQPFRTAGERELLHAAAGVVTTSDWTRDWLRDHYALAGAVVARPGTAPAPPATGSAGGHLLLCVAPVTTAKGYDDLVAALGTVADLDWTCTCVGDLDREPGSVDRVRRRADELGVGDRLRLAGPLDRAALARAYADADLLVHASHGETYGMVVAEALARAVPVLATAAGGLPEALGDTALGAPGRLVPPHDPDTLATAIRGWLTDPALRERWRAAAALRRTTLPTWDETATAVEAALRAV